MDQRTRRSPARFLAPLALIAVLVAFLAILSGSGGEPGSTSGERTTTTSAGTAKTTTRKTSSKAKKKAAGAGKTYTVQVGDTLGGIADKTGVPLERIEELNPNIDPHTLNAGQEIRLK